MLLTIDTSFTDVETEKGITIAGPITFEMYEGERSLGQREFQFSFSAEAHTHPKEDDSQFVEVKDGSRVILACRGPFHPDYSASQDPEVVYWFELFLGILVKYFEQEANVALQYAVDQDDKPQAQRYLLDLWQGGKSALN